MISEGLFRILLGVVIVLLVVLYDINESEIETLDSRITSIEQQLCLVNDLPMD